MRQSDPCWVQAQRTRPCVLFPALACRRHRFCHRGWQILILCLSTIVYLLYTTLISQIVNINNCDNYVYTEGETQVLCVACGSLSGALWVL